MLQRTCKTCGKEFSSKYSNQVFCSPQCRDKHHYKPPVFGNRICKSCGKEFTPKKKSQIHCSPECWDKVYYKDHRNYQKRICKSCGKEFTPKDRRKIFCSQECVNKDYVERTPLEERREYSREYSREYNTMRRNQAAQIAKKPNYTNFGDLRLWSEEDFEHWFQNNYVLFGIKTLLKMDRFFPDVLAETYDGSEVKIELELNAHNFIVHRHDPNLCDLIISFVKPRNKNHIRGIPVISIFDADNSGNIGSNNYDPKSLHLTDYFQSIIDKCVRNLNTFLGTIDHSGTEDKEME